MFLLSAQRVELEVHMDEVTLNRPKILSRLQRHLLVLSVRTFSFALKFSTKIFTPYNFSHLKIILKIHNLLLTILLCRLLLQK